ncbi:MAG: hypothetical protein A3H27_12050 [Acidobacteria bacterium RIFCSPLOWO2_02_FULL_59_13]|nr:MAG: hypothetical protein A3H27_12050 [Acidobacteria bacterium RIFCSPLOWO2_02_FULL_59_13]
MSFRVSAGNLEGKQESPGRGDTTPRIGALYANSENGLGFFNALLGNAPVGLLISFAFPAFRCSAAQ